MSSTRTLLLYLASTAACAAAPGGTYLFDGAPLAPLADGTTSSLVHVPNLGGLVTNVEVTLAIDHAEPDALDLLLVGPFQRAGAPALASILLSDACGGAAIAGQVFAIDEDAPAVPPDSGPCASGTYAPVDYAGAADSWPLFPGPKLPSLGLQWSQNPEGHWRLTLGTHPQAAQGTVGWTLAITTSGYDMLIPGQGTSGIADPYPSLRTVADTATSFGPIVDLDVQLDGLTHTWPAEVSMLLVSPAGTGVVVMSDACGSDDIMGWGFTIDDEAPYLFQPGCNFVHVKPTAQPGVAFPGPARAGPYGGSLAAFDGEDAAGTWRLYVVDTGQNSAGSLVGGWSLALARDGLFRDGFE